MASQNHFKYVLYMCKGQILQKKGDFVMLWFKFTREERKAMKKKIPMTQELFDTIVEKCGYIGSSADEIFYTMLEQYPEQLRVNSERIANEYEINFDEEIEDAILDIDTDKIFYNIMNRIKLEEERDKLKR